MAVIYGLEHFNYYTYGRIVTVQTDHKPILGLIGICSRKEPSNRADALTRAQSTADNFEVLGQEATGQQCKNICTYFGTKQLQEPSVCTVLLFLILFNLNVGCASAAMFSSDVDIIAKGSQSQTTRGLLATNHVSLNHVQVMWTTSELAPPPPNYHSNWRTFQLSTDFTCIAALHSRSLVVLGSNS
ncbi:hypothetical protein TNCV_4961231 [Trichonephila clavipes]|uniref:Reverse transcriptase RNase H-like domain-containing protein n=1 Tax=Trichonephila clavipes TaxID=2585209 RepID=A0A8X6SLS8_TRICX|nr:hypothetical protein TNCV_4961231 [Trichonephila clavipes]